MRYSIVSAVGTIRIMKLIMWHNGSSSNNEISDEAYGFVRLLHVQIGKIGRQNAVKVINANVAARWCLTNLKAMFEVFIRITTFQI